MLGRQVSPEQGLACLQVVTAMAAAYTRGQGFTGGVPNDEISAVILSASARLLSNPSGLAYSETEGPSSVSYHGAFTGWTVAETFVLQRYRVNAL